jgi:lipopolysaccharide/colanic/teichoic acid biosynthesis glycosyltransferase
VNESSLIKRGLDILLSAIALVLLLPFLLVIALLVRLALGRPVLFVQDRPGLNGQIFRIYKFRTMHDLHGPDGEPLPDGARISRVGRFLRASSLDELPELLNVLKGDMSLVGPRPLRVEYLKLYTPEQARRHDVRPGITGWAQVNGRNAVSWEKRFEHDVWYVDHRSLALDLKILGLTTLKVLRGEGISARDHATMPPFTGSSAAGSPDPRLRDEEQR